VFEKGPKTAKSSRCWRNGGISFEVSRERKAKERTTPVAPVTQPFIPDCALGFAFPDAATLQIIGRSRPFTVAVSSANLCVLGVFALDFSRPHHNFVQSTAKDVLITRCKPCPKTWHIHGCAPSPLEFNYSQRYAPEKQSELARISWTTLVCRRPCATRGSPSCKEVSKILEVQAGVTREASRHGRAGTVAAFIRTLQAVTYLKSCAIVNVADAPLRLLKLCERRFATAISFGTDHLLPESILRFDKW